MGIENQGFEVPKVTNEAGPDDVAGQASLEDKGFFKQIVERYPKFKPALLGLLVMATPHLENANAGEMSAEDALKKVQSDTEFVEKVEAFKKVQEAVGSKIPDNVIYSYVLNGLSVSGSNENNGSTYDEKVGGQLPDSMHNFVLSVESAVGMYSKTSADKAGKLGGSVHMFDGITDSIFMVPAGENMVEKGEEITIKGYGPNADDAIRDAFKELAHRTRVRVSVNAESHITSGNMGSESGPADGFSRNSSTSGLLLIKDANVVEVGPNNNQHMDPKINKVEAIVQIKFGAFQK